MQLIVVGVIEVSFWNLLGKVKKFLRRGLEFAKYFIDLKEVHHQVREFFLEILLMEIKNFEI